MAARILSGFKRVSVILTPNGTNASLAMFSIKDVRGIESEGTTLHRDYLSVEILEAVDLVLGIRIRLSKSK